MASRTGHDETQAVERWDNRRDDDKGAGIVVTREVNLTNSEAWTEHNHTVLQTTVSPWHKG